MNEKKDEIAGILDEMRKKRESAGTLRPESPTQQLEIWDETLKEADTREKARITAENERRAKEDAKRRQPDLSKKRSMLYTLNEASEDAKLASVNKTALPKGLRGAAQTGDSPDKEELTVPADDAARAAREEMDRTRIMEISASGNVSAVPVETERPSARDSVIRNSSMKLKGEESGVLNIHAKIDDDFYDMFGNTVVVDREETRRELRRAAKEAQGGERVFIEEEEAPDEYTDESDAKAIRAELSARRVAAVLRLVIVLLFSVLLIGVTLAPAVGIGVDILNPELSPALYAGICAVMGFVLSLIAFKTVWGSVFALVTGKPNADSAAGVAFFMSLVQATAYVFIPEYATNKGLVLYIGVAAVGVLCCEAGRLIELNRICRNFRFVARNGEKYATGTMSDPALALELAKPLSLGERPVVITKRRTAFTEGFMARCFSPNSSEKAGGRLAIVCAAAALAAAVLTYFITGSIVLVLAALAGLSAVSAPFAAVLAGAVPMNAMGRALSKHGAVTLGYGSVKELAESNCMILGGLDIFPRGTITLSGVKTYEKERIDVSILCAASVLVQACDTLAPIFLGVIQNKTEMLYRVDEIKYEDGLGFSAWIAKNRVVIGGREIMERQNIKIPSLDLERRYTKGTRVPLYLAVSGRLHALFTLSYNPGKEIARSLESLANDDVSIMIRTRDWTLSPKRLAAMFKIPEQNITILPDASNRKLSKHLGFTQKCPAAAVHVGSVTSYVSPIINAHRVRRAISRACVVETVGCAFGAALTLFLIVSGSLSRLSLTAALLFQLVWLLLALLSCILHRYNI